MMIRRVFTGILWMAAIIVGNMHAFSEELSSCRARLENGILTLENNRIRRQYQWNNGNLISILLEDRQTAKQWHLGGSAPDCSLPGSGKAVEGKLEVREIAATAAAPAYLEASVITDFGRLQVKRRFRIYPGSPAIACDFYLRGTVAANWAGRTVNAGDLRNVEGAAAAAEGNTEAAVMESVSLPGVHWRSKAVEFFDITDRCNNLVNETEVLHYRAESRLKGNLLMVSEVTDSGSLFLLKEAPPSSVQLAYPGFDFVVKAGEISVCGIGVAPVDLDQRQWTRCYGFVTGVASGGEPGILKALRSYQRLIRTYEPGRDGMIMMNTWGDRNQDKSVSAKFVLNELHAASRLGITHFQIDDGWQTGRSASSAFGGSLKNIWDNPEYWKIDQQKFPQGLKPVIDLGKKYGIEICLWFNPSTDDSYAHWRDDATVLIDLYRRYGIRTFKIDGVFIPDKKADVHLRKMLDTVQAATSNNVVFNLDVTSGRRFGYHYFNEYGNIFLENRYTDWANYYPHWTLRNLWMLSRYMPAQNLQIEFLNISRNAGKYPPGDLFAPSKIPFEYTFAITMMAQPLAWMEATGLPDSLFAIAPMINTYRRLQQDIHKGTILPIGEQPDGTSWTGFQSDAGKSGYLLFFREYNPATVSLVKTFLPAGSKVKLTRILGEGADQTAMADGDGRLTVSLPAVNSYVLYHYQLDEK